MKYFPVVIVGLTAFATALILMLSNYDSGAQFLYAVGTIGALGVGYYGGGMMRNGS